MSDLLHVAAVFGIVLLIGAVVAGLALFLAARRRHRNHRKLARSPRRIDIMRGS
ncbi:MAG: hypothetical protein ACK4K7_02080 [Allosphingosinicella sp.]|uniref:hypothetical protein n=1 Tax=Allosphingosinicella sp. TaxID=2823234 RepID=UPI003934289A